MCAYKWGSAEVPVIVEGEWMSDAVRIPAGVLLAKYV